MSQRRTIKFKAGYWYHELFEKEHRAVIHIGGKTQQNETVHIIVENFKPTVFLELPKRIDWDRTKCKKLYEWLKEKMGLDGPTHYNLTQKYKIHYKVLVYCICLEFPTDDAARKLKNKMSYYRGIHVPTLGSFQQDELKVHEHNIDTVIQFTAKQLITLSSWVKVKETIHEDEEDMAVDDRKYSSADIDAYADWSDVCSTIIQEGSTYVPPKYFSFDIECYSKNHNSKIPNPEIPENVVNQIALTIGILGDKERRRVILTLGNPEYIENSDEIRRHYYSEVNLLLDFKEQLLLYDPDIFLGYNITKFDWNYLIKRAELCGIYKEFSILSRIYGKQAELRTIKWGSSAYGEQKFLYLECHGRTNVDVLIEVERNFRLSNYRLDTVANHFNIGSKDDLSARALFMIWQMTLEILPLIDGKDITLGMCTKLKAQIAKIFTIRQCSGLIRTYRKKLLKCTKDNLCSTVKEGMSLMGKYCIQDTVLVVDLAEKLNIWTTMEEMSNVTNVPVSYLHTRGQQIKVVAQVYRETSKKGYIIPFHKKVDEKEKFQGAMVVEANPGEYELVATLDFASLYPSIMIAFNICHTTILSDSDPTPDIECHVLTFSDHVGCSHDPQKRKKKAADILCKDHRYRFRKVKYIIKGDGTVTREHEGIFPRLQRTMMGTRKLYKKDMAKAEAKVKMNDGSATQDDIGWYKKCAYDIIEKDALSEYEAKMADVDFGVCNAKQLAVKISMNSGYGILGVENGFIPLIKGAASVTAMGRMLIMMAIDYIRKTYPFVKLVYGDSVSHDTPILCRLDGRIFYGTINNLPVEGEYGFDLLEEKEYSIPVKGLEVWSETGFTNINRIIRHKTSKKMYRVFTHTGIVDVTEDHSLLNENAGKIKPTEVNIGTKLLHKDLPKLPNQSSLDHNEGQIQLQCDNEDTVRCANLYLIGISRGYYVSISENSDSIYNLTFDENPHPQSDEVAKIVELPKTNEYVYDLETENHHFSAGIGRMVVHNTDSCMIHFEGKNLEEHFSLIVEASKKTTHHLKCHITGVQDDYRVGVDNKPIADVKSTDPYFMTLTYEEQCHVLDYETSPINLEFENMYGWFLLLTKKRYMAEKFNKKGEVIGETLKGNVLTRRDNSKYLRDTYKLMKCKNVNEEECIRILCERITMLFTRQIPDVDLIIYMGIKSLINYAKSKKVDGKKDVKVFIDANKDVIDDVLGPEDPRLVYSNIPQVLLALKMTRRGEEIPPNTRLEFLYLKNDNAKHQGEKAEDYTYYKENRKDEELEPDRMHYIEKQLSKPVTELMNVRFPKPIIPFIPMESRLLQYVGGLTDLQRYRIANIKAHTRLRHVPVKSKKGDAFYIGWDALRMEGYKPKLSVFKELAEDLKFKEYTFKSDDAKIAYMMDQMKYGTSSNDISAKKYPELLSFCTLWKSMDVIDTKYKQYGITRRKWRKPTYVGPKIRVGAEVVTLVDFGKIVKGSICKIISREDIGKGKQMYWKYDLMVIKGENKGETIEKDVSRNVFTTFVVKNDNMMKNILHYREYYAEVVEQLYKIFKCETYISIRSGESSMC
jgi:DNA polymerase elongation subunit (family B)